MEIISNKDEMVFKNEHNGKTFYSIGLSKKDKDNKYVNGYINVQFKKDIKLENQTKIHIKKAWIDFYIKDKKTIPYIFISEFDEIKEEHKESGTNPYEDFGNSIKTEFDLGEQIQITDEDLPF